MTQTIKRGPTPKYDFEQMPVGIEIKLKPLKQSSFKSTLSKFNKSLPPAERHKYKYDQLSTLILATRIA